jgi:hypothetical protein
MLLAFGPAGSEFRVNTYTASYQWLPSVAMNASGDFILAWTSNDQDGSRYGVYAQRYNAAGVAQGDEFLVNTYTNGDQRDPSVAMDAAGDFVVAWWSNGQDGDDAGVYAQRYNAAGLTQGGEFRVNTYTDNNQWLPSVAMDGVGDFIVTWTNKYGEDGSDYGVYAQRYSTNIYELSATSGDDTLLLRRNGSNFELFRQDPPITTPDFSQPLDAMTSLTLHVLSGDDHVILDLSGGNPIPSGGLVLDGGTGDDLLVIQGNSPTAILSNPNGGLQIGGLPIARDNVETIDLGTNSLILRAEAATVQAMLDTIANQIKTGRNGGLWDGPGLTSSAAAANPKHNTGLAAMQNITKLGGSLYSNFGGQAVGINDILVKYTYNGDTDLNGEIDAGDYFKIDRGFANKSLGYANGDFDYSGIIDANDYFLIDKAFSEHGGPLAAQPALGAKIRRAKNRHAGIHRPTRQGQHHRHR